MNTYEVVNFLISGDIWRSDHQRYLNDFATDLGWKPSYQFALPHASQFASGHLVVEHGLQNSALISFLTKPYKFQDLSYTDLRNLVSGSYNNLIDWHIAVDAETVTFLHNRVDPPKFFTVQKHWSRSEISELSTAAFQAVALKHPMPNVPALDSSLIKTLSFWKRAIATDFPQASLTETSNLFNGLILARAIEDQFRGRALFPAKTLRDLAYTKSIGIVELLSTVLAEWPVSIPSSIWDPTLFDKLLAVDSSISREIIEDFYRNRFQPYFNYDFSVMSKHALSRIYEQYVSLLRHTDNDQQTLFRSMPIQESEKSYGNVYTPEYIARFFSKYVRKEMPLPRFQKTRVGDPACGSGLFLRSMIETKSESLFQERTTQSVLSMFESTLGIDIDENACAATKLSLSLLSLSLIDQIPNQLNVISADSLAVAMNSAMNVDGILDVVVANPPYVNVDHLPDDRKQLVWKILGDEIQGKTDLYLAMLKIAIKMLAKDGFGCFVLPKNFLLSKNAAPLRSILVDQAVIRCVVDLSAVSVFDDVGAYVILLIFQKRSTSDNAVPVLAVTCSDSVGIALEDALNERITKNPQYQVYWSDQPAKADLVWQFAYPEQKAFHRRLSTFPSLGEIAQVRQGVITGADDIFIREAGQVPKRERAIYTPFLRDRDMKAYVTPANAERFLIYPFDMKGQLSEDRLRTEYPQTWEYLLSHKSVIEKRKSFASGKGPWWRPLWPREPKTLLCQKILTPHIVITPKFSFDLDGHVAVSRSPYIVPKEPFSEDEGLFLLAVLNSTTCFWLITQNSHNYARGYLRLEAATLRGTPIPPIASLQPRLRSEIIALTKKRITEVGGEALKTEALLDEMVARAYGLTSQEMEIVGVSDGPMSA